MTLVPQRCVVCGSERIIPGATIWDQGQHSDGQLKVGIAANPQAMVFKDFVFTRLRAAICGDCGRVELAVEEPGKLYEAYLRNREATQG